MCRSKRRSIPDTFCLNLAQQQLLLYNDTNSGMFLSESGRWERKRNPWLLKTGKVEEYLRTTISGSDEAARKQLNVWTVKEGNLSASALLLSPVEGLFCPQRGSSCGTFRQGRQLNDCSHTTTLSKMVKGSPTAVRMVSN